MSNNDALLGEEQYLVHNIKEVAQILKDLAKNNVMLKASFNEGNDVYLTTVIAVDDIKKCAYLDIGRDDAFNARLLDSDHVTFSKDDGVKIRWVSGSVSEVNLKDGRAIKIALPRKMLRLQRREFFRLVTPRMNPVPCQIPIVDEDDADQERILELTLTDISLGGIGAIAQDPLDKMLAEGASFERCKISFPDIGVTSLTLKVRYIVPIHLKDGTVKHRVGLQFIEPSRGNQGLIQRYTFALERAALALANGTGK
jgi:c-di-GMP-binding flagellar brake protein YcgR